MNDFDLKYGDPDDFLNANKMLDFKTVRRKNHESILFRVNKKGFGGRSSSFNVTIGGGYESARWAVPVERASGRRDSKNQIFGNTGSGKVGGRSSGCILPSVSLERK
jgi:hypothetical protein